MEYKFCLRQRQLDDLNKSPKVNLSYTVAELIRDVVKDFILAVEKTRLIMESTGRFGDETIDYTAYEKIMNANFTEILLSQSASKESGWAELAIDLSDAFVEMLRTTYKFDKFISAFLGKPHVSFSEWTNTLFKVLSSQIIFEMSKNNLAS